MYSDQLISEVKSGSNLVELVRESVDLRQRGQEWEGMCPFHSDDKPKLKVNPRKGIWKCFGCDEGGNVFSWVMRSRGVPFGEAVRVLARKANIKIDDDDSVRQLTLADGAAVLQLLGLEVDSTDSKVKAPCPFGAWDHANKKDEHPSFALLRTQRGDLVGKCLACGFRGGMERMLLRLQFLSGRNLHQVLDLVRPRPQTLLERVSSLGKTVQADVERLKGAEFEAVLAWDEMAGMNRVNLDAVEYELIPEGELEPHAGSVPRYALERGLSLDNCRLWELAHDKRRKRLLFPVKNHRLELVGVTGRKYDPDAWGPKYLHSRGKWRSMVFYGEHLFDPGLRSAVIVEGTFDVLAVHQAGVRNVLGMLGSWLGKIQKEKLIQWVDELVLLPDGDKAGREAAERIQEALRDKMDVRIAELPEGKDPADLSVEEIRKLVAIGAPALLTFPDEQIEWGSPRMEEGV
jgi:5S rRNA maturation endonuclease (ribonuclease M5)